MLARTRGLARVPMAPVRSGPKTFPSTAFDYVVRSLTRISSLRATAQMSSALDGNGDRARSDACHAGRKTASPELLHITEGAVSLIQLAAFSPPQPKTIPP
jgi:hypothetical protein